MPSQLRRRGLAAALLLLCAAAASAQVVVEVKAEKRVYAPGETVAVTVSATNVGKQPAEYPLPAEVAGGLTVQRVSDGRPETVAQGAPPATKEPKALAPGEAWSEKVEITAKLAGEGAYQVSWKGADGQDAKMATFAIWTPETLAALEDTVVLLDTTHGPIALEFKPKLAPLSVQCFLNLARKGFYTGKSFHRVIAGFMMQGGCPAGNGTGNPGYKIAGEFGDVKHERGTLAMAREKSPDSAGCQFYICFGPAPWLDEAGYTVFGRMIWGDEALAKVEKVLTDHHTLKGKCGVNHRDLPLDDVKINDLKIGKHADFPPPQPAGESKGG